MDNLDIWEDEIWEVKTSDNNNSGWQYSTNLLERKIMWKYRTFYIDLKSSDYWKFLKISEKSRGTKKTIMMDIDDFDQFMDVLAEVKDIVKK